MTHFIIGPSEKTAIAKAIALARAKPVPIAMIMAFGNSDTKFEIKLNDRPPGFERPASEHLMLGDIRVAFSIEEQPAGLVAHLSASVPTKGKLPNEIVIESIVREFGFRGDLLSCEAKVWLEEFDPGHEAVNVVWLLVPAQVGNA